MKYSMYLVQRGYAHNGKLLWAVKRHCFQKPEAVQAAQGLAGLHPHVRVIHRQVEETTTLIWQSST